MAFLALEYPESARVVGDETHLGKLKGAVGYLCPGRANNFQALAIGYVDCKETGGLQET